MRTFEENIGEFASPWTSGSPVLHAGLLAFPARLLSGLPAAVRIDLVDEAMRPLVIATGAAEAEALRGEGATVIDGPEWTALAEATESDRMFANDLTVLLGLRGPGRITSEVALSGARADPPRGWSVGTVLGRLGLEVAVTPRNVAVANESPSALDAPRRAA